jgi:hypothetical protein
MIKPSVVPIALVTSLSGTKKLSGRSWKGTKWREAKPLLRCSIAGPASRDGRGFPSISSLCCRTHVTWAIDLSFDFCYPNSAQRHLMKSVFLTSCAASLCRNKQLHMVWLIIGCRSSVYVYHFPEPVTVLSLQDTRVAGKVRRDLGQRRHFPIHVVLFSPAKNWSLSHVLRNTAVVIFYHVCNSRAQMSSSTSRRLADHDVHHEEETGKGWALHTRNARFRPICMPIITSWRAVFHTHTHTHKSIRQRGDPGGAPGKRSPTAIPMAEVKIEGKPMRCDCIPKNCILSLLLFLCLVSIVALMQH